jgi:hypothetical protein
MGRMSQLQCLIIFVICASAIGCRPEQVDLSFHTLERREMSGTGEIWQHDEPGLLIVATLNDVPQLSDLVTREAEAKLQNLDLDQHFAVAVFQGMSFIVVPGIVIQRISQSGDTITIYAHILELVAEAQRPLVVSPYHLVAVQRGDELQGDIEFVLNVDGKVVSRKARVFP